MKDHKIKTIVRKGYAKIAKQDSSCTTPACSCCGGTDLADTISRDIGYSEEDLKTVPEGANLGLGCGNPVALASVRDGDTVLDLGSGAGFDCFLAAQKVGKNGKVIGVDMTPEMVDKARENSQKENYENVEFRLGEIENLPVADNSVDLLISNCVINLSPDKRQVFREAFRVLKSGGRLMISDIVLLKELPDFINNSIEAYIGCISGAILKNEYIEAIKAAGFKEVRIIDESIYPPEVIANDPTAKLLTDKLKIPPEQIKDLISSVASIKVYGLKS
ncbi:MAG: arsenite methyltransferase [Candidatus Aminicenantaceae bacterium]